MSQHAQDLCSELGLTYIGILGSGAFKNVYRVSRQGVDLVLKISKHPGTSARDFREIESLQRCDHPRIAKVFDSGLSSQGGATFQYIVESFCGGDSLGDLVRNGWVPNPEQLGSIGSTLIDCLGHLELKHLVHRDIKPDNLIMNSQGEVTLIDFGLVRDLANVSLTNSWMHMGPGTPFYAAPEQLINEKSMIGWKTDQFCLGVTLCELFYGFHPYQNQSDSPRSPEIVNRVASRQSHGDCLQVDPNARSVFQIMTNQWPIKRFPTNAALAAAWMRFIATI